MAKRPLPSIADDFTAVMAFLKTRRVVPESPAEEMLQTARRIHRATYSLFLWRFRLIRLKEHGSAFIEEIASDALQVLPQSLMGYVKTTKLLTRGVVENVLRHIYFSDHPVEFEKMNREQKWFMTNESLFEYARVHPLFMETELKFDALNRLKVLYGELSAGIHGSKVRDLEMRVALRKIKYDQAAADVTAREIERCAESANFILAMFHREKMNRFQTEDQRIILRTMSPRARQVWRDL